MEAGWRRAPDGMACSPASSRRRGPGGGRSRRPGCRLLEEEGGTVEVGLDDFHGSALGPRPRVAGVQVDAVRNLEPAEAEGVDLSLIHISEPTRQAEISYA